MSRPSKAVIDDLSKKLVDQGLLMEAGWQGLKLAVLPEAAPEVQLREMRMAFFAGAQHLFSSIMAIMDADREPTAADMRRMSFIDMELKGFVKEMELRAANEGGHA